ncbi:putative tryptophan dimethylallyltransferase [Aspergillus pseudonomiae]|nr:putative tryptophan dimethylallyltransferase [Aspergillus pseudonomiae]
MCEGPSGQFDPRDENQKAWWLRTGALLERILKDASYSPDLQQQYLDFYRKVLVPALGLFPSCFHSAITFTGLPLEFSVNYQQSSVQPVVRISIEAVNSSSGTAEDPYNQTPMRGLITRLRQMGIQGFDATLLNHFIQEHSVGNGQKSGLTSSQMDKIDSVSQAAFGFDLKKSGISVKGYTFPGVKCLLSGVPLARLLKDSIHEKVTGIDSSDAFTVVNDYMEETDGYNTFCFFSWDCVSPQKSRLKFYGSYDSVTWAKLEDIWTLGGRNGGPSVRRGLEYFRQLWNIVCYGKPTSQVKVSTDEVYATKTPLIWNYEMKSGNPFPATKLYIPVQGKNDGEVAQSIALFFREVGMDAYADSYVRTVESYFPDHDLETSESLISWISFAYSETTGVYLSVYYNGMP